MTPAHLAAMEKAARIYCVKVSMDPDVKLPVPHETLEGVMTTQPFWQIIAEKMIDLALMLAAMKESSAPAANDGPTTH